MNHDGVGAYCFLQLRALQACREHVDEQAGLGERYLRRRRYREDREFQPLEVLKNDFHGALP